MNKVIEKGPAFPVYSLSEPTDDDPGIDISDAQLEQIERATDAWIAEQIVLANLYRGV